MQKTIVILLLCIGFFVPKSIADWNQLPPNYILYKYNDVYQRQAHNAYDYGHDWISNFDNGIYNVEIDIRNHNPYDGQQDWKVRHDAHGGEKNICGATWNQSFKVCLQDIRSWHDQHPNHFPITIVIDKKDEWDHDDDRKPHNFDWRLEKELGKENIFRPADLKADYSTLREAAFNGAWPTLRSLLGKFIIIITPHESWNESRKYANEKKAAEYVRKQGVNALAFVCPRGHVDEIYNIVSGFSYEDSGWVVCFNHKEDQINGDAGYGNGLRLRQAGYILRVWNVNSWLDYNRAVHHSLANFIAVDNPITNSYVAAPEGFYGSGIPPLLPIVGHPMMLK